MFITIKDTGGNHHVCPLNLITVFEKDNSYCCRVKYNEWHGENLEIDKEEYKRIKKTKNREDKSFIMDAIQSPEV